MKGPLGWLDEADRGIVSALIEGRNWRRPPERMTKPAARPLRASLWDEHQANMGQGYPLQSVLRPLPSGWTKQPGAGKSCEQALRCVGSNTMLQDVVSTQLAARARRAIMAWHCYGGALADARSSHSPAAGPRLHTRFSIQDLACSLGMCLGFTECMSCFPNDIKGADVTGWLYLAGQGNCFPVAAS